MTMPTIKTTGTRRIEMKLTSEGIRRLQSLKKIMRVSKNTEVMEALLFQAAVDQKIDPDVSERIEQKIDYLIERIEMMT